MADATRGWTIVPMRPRHLRGVVAIERQTSHRPWSLDLFDSELRLVGSDAIVAVGPHAEVVGFGCSMSTGFEAHVTNIAVDPARQREGIGRALVARLIRIADERGLCDLTLEVRASNEPAKELYASFGFRQEGVRPKYYAESGEDALILWLRRDAPGAPGRAEPVDTSGG